MRTYSIGRIFPFVALLVFMAGCATAPKTGSLPAAREVAVITDIRFQDNGLTVAANQNFAYTVYTTDDPYRITVEIPDMTAGKFTSKMTSDKSGITEVAPLQVEGPKPSVKLDMVLQTPSAVVPMYKDNVLTIVIKAEEPVLLTDVKETTNPPDDPPAEVSRSAASGGKEAAEGQVEKEPAAEKVKAEPPSPPMARATEITKIELKKSTDALKVVITGNGSMAPNVFPLDGRIVIDVPGVSMRASVPSSVVSPLRGIRAGKHQDKVRLVLDLKAKTPFDVAAEGNAIEVSLRKEAVATPKAPLPAPAVHAEEAAAPEESPDEKSYAEVSRAPGILSTGETNYRGKKISLDFQNAEVGPIFRLLADVNGFNLVLDPAVKGRITIKLMNVPWDQALEIILNQTHLSHRIEGNILWIAPVTVFDQIVKERAKLQETEEGAEPLVQDVIRVNYATAGELSSAISQGKLLSPRGSITIDSRMNTLIIKDSRTSINKIQNLVKIMDVAKPQVMIEAKIVQVSSSYTESLGIRWGGSFFAPAFPNTAGGNFSVNTPTVQAGPTTVNPGGTLDMTIGSANTFKVNLSLSALETMGKSKTLSNPKILTMDNEAATIQQGTTFFIPTVSQAGTQTQQQQATLSLTVTPKITPDGYVQLKVNATDNSLQPGTAGANAVVDTKSLTTQALVRNGETLVLGGIYASTETESEDGVPLLSKIPGLGWLFKTKTTTGPDIKELLIFITPNIIQQNKQL